MVITLVRGPRSTSTRPASHNGKVPDPTREADTRLNRSEAGASRNRTSADPPRHETSTSADVVPSARSGACPPRLYAFSAVFVRNTPDRQVAATFDFHVLCPTEFEPARAFHLQLQKDPDAIAPDTIFDRAEGVHCPECRQLRVLLNQ